MVHKGDTSLLQHITGANFMHDIVISVRFHLQINQSKKLKFINDIIKDFYAIKRDQFTLLKQQNITNFVTIFIVNNINPKLDCYDFFV